MFQFLLPKGKLSEISAAIWFLGLICHLVEQPEQAESSTSGLCTIPGGCEGLQEAGAALQHPCSSAWKAFCSWTNTSTHREAWSSDISPLKRNSCKLPNVRNGPSNLWHLWTPPEPDRSSDSKSGLAGTPGFQAEKEKRHFGTCLQTAGNALLVCHKNKAGKAELVQTSASEATVFYLEQDVYFTFCSEHFSKAAKPGTPKSNS